MFWDELQTPAEVEASIEQIRHITARQLKLDPEQVLPLSARQGFLGKVGRNLPQLRQSNFPELERKLADLVVQSQQQIIGHHLVGDSYEIIINSRNSLVQRLGECEYELLILRNTAPQEATETLQQLRDTIRQTHHEYHKQALSLRTSQRLLESQRQTLLAPVCPELLQQQFDSAYSNLSKSWTTLGLTRAIGSFFDDVDNNLSHVEREIDRVNQLLISIYKRAHQRPSGDELMMKHLLKIHRQRRQLRQLHKRADDFRYSFKALSTFKNVLIDRFVSTLVQEVRNTYQDLNEHINQWLAEALAPLIHHNQHQKQLTEAHMLRLTQLQMQRTGHSEQIANLQANLLQLRAALSALEPLYQEVISAPLAADASAQLAAERSGRVVSLLSARQAARRKSH
jgi:hypothetical protein